MLIRVMHVVRHAEGGMLRHIRELLRGLPNHRIQNFVVCPEQSPLFRQLPSWVQRCALPVEDGVKPWRDARCLISLRSLIDKHEVEILHLHGAKAAMLGRTAALLSQRRPRVICTYHNFVEPENRFLKAVYETFEKTLSAATDRYIAVSNALAGRLSQQIDQQGKIVTVYNGLSPERSHLSRERARELMNVPQDAFVMGTIARLVPEKGVQDLLLAFRLLRNHGYHPYLVIVGDGPQKEALQQLAAGMEDRIRWMGAVEEACRLMGGFDLYIQSSRKEGFGLAVLEAMRTGVPVIATNVGGLPEAIGASRIGVNEAGVLVPERSPRHLCEWIMQLIRDEPCRIALGTAGRRRVQEQFSLAGMIQGTMHVYQDVLANGGCQNETAD